jgi:uncharacterized protein YkwD
MPSLRLPTRAAILAVVVAAAAFTSALAAAPAPAHALTNCTGGDASLDGEERAFLDLINAYRAEHGLVALKVSTNLNRAAAWMAADLATNDYWGHTDRLGRSPGTRAQQCDYPGGAGENLAAGTYRASAQTAFDAWRNSPGHNQNMLDGRYRMIGIARHYDAGATYGWYWVTPLGLDDDGTDGLGGESPAPAAVATSESPLATITAPASGTTFPGTSASFTRSEGNGVDAAYLYVGTCVGCSDLAEGYWPDATTLTLDGLPANSVVYVRLWSFVDGAWQGLDFVYVTGS